MKKAACLSRGIETLAICENLETEIFSIVRWYFTHWHGVWDGTIPFYCKGKEVGCFKVPEQGLARGDEDAIFQLLVVLSMYQALRDVVIKKQQRKLTRSAVRVVLDLGYIGRLISRHGCPAFKSANNFERECDVRKKDGAVDCGYCPGVPCQVKDATVIFNRMGDMGKLPSSAWLRLWKTCDTRRVLEDIRREEKSPSKRSELLVNRFTAIHRIGRKVATMFVSALSTPALAPGLTPWFPDVDGNELVVIDTNVARAVDYLQSAKAAKTYSSREAWIRKQASRIDLREFSPDVPSYSPRLVQQALYAFCSKSNRTARNDPCMTAPGSCHECAPALCPFARKCEKR